MNEVAVGIDIGTSYTKAAARTMDGSVVAVYRKPTSHVRVDPSIDLRSATAWWSDIKEVFHGLLLANNPHKVCVKSICVSAIAPTLTVFDAAHPDCAYAILYSSLAELEDGGSLSQCDPQLTQRRIAILDRVARKEKFVEPYITDLVGYVNWRLAGILTVNSISLVEMGITQAELLSVADNISPQLVAVGEQIGETAVWSASKLGIESGIPVCGGCPDTMSSVMGAGLVKASETMLYLGTFGSILHLEQNVDTLLEAKSLQNLPFRWVLSVPGFGPRIESLSEQWFGSFTASKNLRALDQLAAQASPGAGGSLFLVPRWKNGMTPIGRYEFVPNRSGDLGDIRRQARAVLESIAYAALVAGAHSSNPIYVAGGGARSHIWLDAISTVLGSNVQARHMAWEATGAADIAARNAWKFMPVTRPWYTSCAHNTPLDVVKDNYNRTKEYYHEYNWL